MGSYCIIWFAGIIFLTLWGYKGSFLFLNSMHTDWMDVIMPHYTHLGDGVIVSMVFSLCVLPKHKSIVLSLIVSLLFVSLSIFIFKHYVFADWDRPLREFQGIQQIHYISLDQLTRHSFPSGHSAAAAAMFTIIAYHFERNKYFNGILLSIFMMSIAYSRVYIGVHFLGDILAGTLLGVLLALIVLQFIFPPLKKYFTNLSTVGNARWNVGLYLFIIIAILISINNLYQVYFHD